MRAMRASGSSAGRCRISKSKCACVGHDVEGLAAADTAHMQRGIGNVVIAVARTTFGGLGLQGADGGDDIECQVDGIDAFRRQTGMRLKPGAGNAHRRLALVGGHHSHERGFADDGKARSHRRFLQHVDEPSHPDTADFLVIAEGKVDRRGECPPRRRMRHGQARGDKPLHVGAAASIKAPALAAQGKGIARPCLALDRHHVGVAREHDAGLIARSDGGIEIGLFARLVMHQLAVDAEPRQFLAHEGDEVEIAVPAHRREGDRRSR